jgi:hypothetical protein
MRRCSGVRALASAFCQKTLPAVFSQNSLLVSALCIACDIARLLKVPDAEHVSNQPHLFGRVAVRARDLLDEGERAQPVEQEFILLVGHASLRRAENREDGQPDTPGDDGQLDNEVAELRE